MLERSAEATGGRIPPGTRRLGHLGPTECGGLVRLPLEHGDDGRELLRRRVTRDDPDVRPDRDVRPYRDGSVRGDGCCVSSHQRGMFPCFFGGSDARFPRSARSALMTETRVACGWMMPSSSPRSAAR